MAEKGEFDFPEIDEIGTVSYKEDYYQKHIDAILKLDLVEVEAIKAKKYKIVVDAVNSSGGIAVPMLLNALGVRNS